MERSSFLGMDLGSPVSLDHYERAPFAFNGMIENVHIQYLTSWVENDIVNKSGAWFNYGEVKLGQGREKAKQFITDNPELIDEIKQHVLAAKGLIEVKEK